MSFSNVVYGSEGMQFGVSANKSSPLGNIMILPDGSEYVYARAGGVALDVGKLMQQAVVVTGHTKDLSVAADAAIGATKVTLTNSTTAITANMYAEGYMYVNDATGEGYRYKIKSHPAESTGSGTVVITLEEGSALRVALTASVSEVGLRKHKADAVLVAPTSFTGVIVGATVRAVPLDYYCWLQKKGTAVLLTNGTVIKGMLVTRSATTPGAIDVYPLNSSDNDGQQPPIGTVESVAASTEYSLVNLNIV